MAVTKEELSLSIDETQWEWLRSHVERGGLILAANDLNLAEVGKKVADDDAAEVSGWIASGKLTKPSAEQIAEWDGDREKMFRVLIVSPYVLIQE